jgi:hypothetical protein
VAIWLRRSGYYDWRFNRVEDPFHSLDSQTVCESEFARDS